LRRHATSPLSDGAVAACDTGAEEDAVGLVRRRLSPGPLRPATTAGHALRRILRVAPEHFRVFQDYEVLRAKLGGEEVSAAEEAEALVFFAYWQLLQHGSCPGRPAASDAADYRDHVEAFCGAALEALERSASPDFRLLAQAHVKVLLQGLELPWLPLRQARSLYEGAMKFGHALRQAETRFQVDGAAGTFVPLPVEAQMAREELEAAWARSLADGAKSAGEEPGKGKAEEQQHEDDAEGAKQSLEQVLARLRRMGQERPGLATYLSWLGNFDPEAWSLLMQPSPLLELAMAKQLDAVWGDVESTDEDAALTPSDLIEAVLFGAWLRDAEFAAEDMLSKHRQMGCEEQDREP